MSKIKFQETANGRAYTLDDTTLVFTPEPCLLWISRMTSVDQPERFGTWDTSRARRAYVRAFVAAVKAAAADLRVVES